VKTLEADVRDWIGLWNESPLPYVWVKTADQILNCWPDISSEFQRQREPTRATNHSYAT